MRRPTLALGFMLALACPGRGRAARPGSARGALAAAGRDFRAGDSAAARAALDPWVARSPRAAREDLAVRFLAQDFAGVLALAHSEPPADDEARLWAARADAALGAWPDCLARLSGLKDPGRPWPLCLRAEALAALGDPLAASACARALSAAAGTNLVALAALQAADTAEARGDSIVAESCYKRAQKADPSYALVVDGRLADLYLDEGRWPDAWARLERERAVDPLADGPRRALAALLAAHPELREGQGASQDALLAAFEARPAPRVPPLARLPGEPLVRVGLLSGSGSVVFRLGAPMLDEASGLTLAAGADWVACTGDPGTWVLAPFGDNPFPGARTFTAALRLRPLDPASTFGLFHVSHGLGYFFAGADDRYYRGLLEISRRPEGLLVVDELGLESLLCSVVPSEVPHGWPMECLKAQAIAARTAAWAWLGHGRREGYDFTERREAYAGAGVETPETDAAVTATAGVVLENAGQGLASTYYMDDSGGHTLPAGEVWSGPAPDSVGVADCPAGSDATLDRFPLSASGLLHYLDDPDRDVQGWSRNEGHAAWRWILRLTPEDLQPSVDRIAPVGRPRAVLGLVRDAGGTLESVRVSGDLGAYTVSGDRIRTALKGLKSNLFYVEPRFDAQGRAVAFLFHGGGWGHGVGLSQSGAKAMAEAGLDDHAILRHYFPRDRISRRYPDSSGAPPGASIFDPSRGRTSEGEGF